MSLPALAAAALVVTMLAQSKKKSPKQVVKTAHRGQTPGGHYLTRPTNPSQMWVDRPQNTTLRNDAQGQDPHAIDAYLREIYSREATCHPGVRLVAGQAVA